MKNINRAGFFNIHLLHEAQDKKHGIVIGNTERTSFSKKNNNIMLSDMEVDDLSIYEMRAFYQQKKYGGIYPPYLIHDK